MREGGREQGDRDVVLEVKGLQKTFRIGFLRKRVEAVRGVDFAVRKGEIFGLLGPNGAGKTTTIKSILRLIFPSAGTIRIFGLPPERRESMHRVGYMPENPYVYQYLKPLEFLDLCGRLMGMKAKERAERAEAMLEQVGLAHAKDRPIGKFSKGMMQRVGLAQALLHDPELLVLDEPMSGLDPNQAAEIRELIKQIGEERTVILSTHDLAEVQVTCSRVLIIANGRLVADDTPDELRERAGKASYQVTVLAKEGAYRDSEQSKAVRDALGKIGGVASVRQREAEGKDELLFTVLPKSAEDIRAEIFQSAVDGGFVLLGLEKKAEALDKVFRDLTTGDTEELSAREQKKAEARARKKKRDAAKKADAKAEAKKAEPKKTDADADDGDDAEKEEA